MIAETLKDGGVIGICSPSHVARREKYDPLLKRIRDLGFIVRESPNLYRDTYGYLATPEERAEDLNELINDPGIDMILFGGGEGANELLPLIDFEAFRKHPKRIVSYSDGTTLLNTIRARSGLVTYYGQMTGMFEALSEYDHENFRKHIQGDQREHISSAPWKPQTEGTAEGILIGGYLVNFAMLLNTVYTPVLPGEEYILFLEDHEKFGDRGHISAFLSYIEQSGFMSKTKGLLFGHYSDTVYPELLARLKRIGEKYRIPVAYCDDFGHGKNHAILQIGRQCRLDTKNCTLKYL